MLNHAQIDSLLLGQFELSFLKLVLRKNAPGSSMQFEGPGEVRQTPGGELLLRLFDAKAMVTFSEAWVAGEVIADGEYFTLEGTAVDGSNWTAKYVLPDPNWAMGGLGCVVVARLREICSDSAAVAPRTSARLKLVFAEALDLPPTGYSQTRVEAGRRAEQQVSLDTSEFDAAGLSFHCRTFSDRTIVQARSPLTMDANADARIVEAFQFLLGTEVHPVYTHRAEGSNETECIRSERRQTAGGKRAVIDAPLPLDFPRSADAWRLFDCYLRFVKIHTAPDEPHPVSAEWHTLILSSYSGLEGQALQVAVSAEAVLKLTDEAGAKLKPVLSGEDQEVANWVTLLEGILTREGCIPALRLRVQGFFRQLFEMSSSNRLKRLADIGAIDSSLIKSWTILRNTRAHGVRGKLKAPEQVLAAHGAVIELLYQLVFHAIGYKGPFIAYGSRGWPAKTYPDDV